MSKSDIQIAREAKMKPINEILGKINVPDEPSAFSPMGRHIAKINLEYLDGLKDKQNGKLILSGILNSQQIGIIKLLNLNYLEVDNVSSEKDWVCIKSTKK